MATHGRPAGTKRYVLFLTLPDGQRVPVYDLGYRADYPAALEAALAQTQTPPLHIASMGLLQDDAYQIYHVFEEGSGQMPAADLCLEADIPFVRLADSPPEGPVAYLESTHSLITDGGDFVAQVDADGDFTGDWTHDGQPVADPIAALRAAVGAAD